MSSSAADGTPADERDDEQSVAIQGRIQCTSSPRVSRPSTWALRIRSELRGTYSCRPVLADDMPGAALADGGGRKEGRQRTATGSANRLLIQDVAESIQRSCLNPRADAGLGRPCAQSASRRADRRKPPPSSRGSHRASGSHTDRRARTPVDPRTCRRRELP